MRTVVGRTSVVVAHLRLLFQGWVLSAEDNVLAKCGSSVKNLRRRAGSSISIFS